MTSLKQQVKELKKDTRSNIKIDKAYLATYAALFLAFTAGGLKGSIQAIAEDPKNIDGYMILPACLVMYFFIVAGNAAMGNIKPKMPDAHMAKYKEQLKELYKKYQKIPQSQKTK